MAVASIFRRPAPVKPAPPEMGPCPQCGQPGQPASPRAFEAFLKGTGVNGWLVDRVLDLLPHDLSIPYCPRCRLVWGRLPYADRDSDRESG